MSTTWEEGREGGIQSDWEGRGRTMQRERERDISSTEDVRETGASLLFYMCT